MWVHGLMLVHVTPLLVEVGIIFVLFVIVLLVDYDLVLAFYCKFGKKPSEALSGKVIWITGASSGIGHRYYM